MHIYGSFVVKPSILLTSRLVPYYFPISMSTALEKMGFERHTLDLDDIYVLSKHQTEDR